MNDEKFAIFEISGGMGKNILATCVLHALKEKYNDYKFIVVTAWQSPWFNNPDVERVYLFNQLTYFFKDFINENTKIFKIEPYSTEDYIMKKKHLISSWGDLYDVEINEYKPKLYINPMEIEYVRDIIKPLENRPIFIIQTNGGGDNQKWNKSWARDLPIDLAQQIVNHYVNQGYRVLHIRTDKQPALHNTEQLKFDHRELYTALLFSKKRLLIDSFAQHACAALSLKSTVCWIGNDPKILGYDIHDNIMPKLEKNKSFLKYSYLDEFDITGNVQQFPYSSNNVFDINEIVKSIDNQ